MQRRPVFAAALALVPALGHAYLRRWSRAVAWLALMAGSASVLAGLFGVGVVDAVAPGVAPGGLPIGVRVVVPLSLLLALSAVDAYVLARRDARVGGVTCPRCGRQVDLSISFCWYCSVEFEFVER